MTALETHLVYAAGAEGAGKAHVAWVRGVLTFCGRRQGAPLAAPRVPISRVCRNCRAHAGDISRFVEEPA